MDSVFQKKSNIGSLIVGLILFVVFVNEGYSETYVSKELGIQVNTIKNWKIIEEPNYLHLAHRSGEATCSFGLQRIPGVELLTQEELEKKLNTDLQSKDWVSKAMQFRNTGWRYMNVTSFNKTTISGKKAIETDIEFDDSPKTPELSLNLKGPKKTRLISTITNAGSYSFACTSSYGDFDTANRAFDIILNGVKILQ